MLNDLLNQKQCFKLVCGAGNEDLEEIEKLIYIYSLAGCPFFDISAKIDVLETAKKALEKAGIKKDRYICISVGIEGDPHITKAVIDEKKCTNCQKCISLCPHQAIENKNKIEINKKRCLGCTICQKECPKNAITMQSQLKKYDEIIPQLTEKGIDCIEFHAISNNENDILEKWKELNSLYDGMLCISIDRSEFGDKKLIELTKEMTSKRKNFSTIIQADGVAMSGNNDELGTTLQAIAATQMFQKASLNAYIMMSGGTNIKSTQLASKCGVKPHCLAVGSYARKIIKQYIDMPDLLQNQEAINQAVKIAKNLIETSLENMKND